jgi:myo-inositol catabolism protein IolC
MPLIANEGWPIRITVSHGIVERYIKWVYNFHPDESIKKEVQPDVQTFIDAATHAGEHHLFDIYMGYRFETNNMLQLYWFAENTQGQLIWKPVN